MFVLSETGLTSVKIAAYFDMDHASIAHAIRAIRHAMRWEDSDKKVALIALVDALRQTVKAHPVELPLTHGSGYGGESRVVNYLVDLKIEDSEWCFNNGVRFLGGYMVALKKITTLPKGPLLVLIEHERDHYDYMYIEMLRRGQRGPTV